MVIVFFGFLATFYLNQKLINKVQTIKCAILKSTHIKAHLLREADESKSKGYEFQVWTTLSSLTLMHKKVTTLVGVRR